VDKRRGPTFADVVAIGRTLPDVEVTTAWAQPALKVNGKMFVCMAAHKSAEPNSLIVMMGFGDRDALRDLVLGAYRFVKVQTRGKSDAASRRGTTRRSRNRR